FLSHEPAATERHTLSLHDALPIFGAVNAVQLRAVHQDRGEAEALAGDAVVVPGVRGSGHQPGGDRSLRDNRRGQLAEQPEVRAVDRKSTRLNSSHVKISYAVFCLK